MAKHETSTTVTSPLPSPPPPPSNLTMPSLACRPISVPAEPACGPRKTVTASPLTGLARVTSSAATQRAA